MQDLKIIASEINQIIKDKQKELQLTFIEDTHTYFMLDKHNVLRNDFPSVSKVLKKYYSEFPAEEKSYLNSGKLLLIMLLTWVQECIIF